jgi:hypothetical protein
LEEDKDIGIFSQLKKELIEYVELRSQLARISTYEIISKSGASLISALALVIFIFFFLFFMYLALGFYLSNVLDSFYKGFGLIALFYFILILFFLLLRKKYIERPIANKIIENLSEHHES